MTYHTWTVQDDIFDTTLFTGSFEGCKAYIEENEGWDEMVLVKWDIGPYKPDPLLRPLSLQPI